MAVNHSLSIRFCGDSGDGIQLVGHQFTLSAAQQGYEVQTKPDFPAEIRAPGGTLAGVSGFDIAIADNLIQAPNDEVDVLVALNPAALHTGLAGLKPDGLLIINRDSFGTRDWNKAGLDKRMLESVRQQTITVAVSTLTQSALNDFDFSHSQINKTKNFVVLGIVLWLFDLSISHCKQLIMQKFAANEVLVKANQAALQAGYNYGISLELSRQTYHLQSMQRQPGQYRQITGIQAMSLACATVCYKTQLNLLVSGYPITPASALLHELAQLKHCGITLFQAEDEIAAVCSAMGASFGGKLALTCTSGPGLDLKSEGLSLAVMAELPLVLVDVQRAGPSTGLPTKTEQSDLLMALYGRHGESPLPVLAAASPADCFLSLLEAFQIAVRAMTPVILLIDASLANGAQSWQIPDPDELPFDEVCFNQRSKPYARLDNLSRPWIVPGTPGHIHHIGGLEKQGESGKVCYDADNHQTMVGLRQKKIDGISHSYPESVVEGVIDSDCLVLSWGSTYGSIKTAIERCEFQNVHFALVHLRHLNPLPNDLAAIVQRYRRVFVVELNQGQLLQVIRAKYLIDATGINQCDGKAFSVSSLVARLCEEYHHG